MTDLLADCDAPGRLAAVFELVFSVVACEDQLAGVRAADWDVVAPKRLDLIEPP